STTDVWFAGDAGVVLHYDGVAMSRVETGTSATLFGIYAVSPFDVWAVGGTPGDPTGEQDVILRWDGRSLQTVEPAARMGISSLSIAYQATTGLVVAGEGGMMA